MKKILLDLNYMKKNMNYKIYYNIKIYNNK